MKKIMMIMAVVLFVGMAQAGTYGWNTGVITLSTGVAATTGQVMGFLFNDATISRASMVALLEGGTIADDSDFVSYLRSKATSGSVIAETNQTLADGSTTLYVVVYDTVNDMYKVSNTITKNIAASSQTYSFGTQGIATSTGWASVVPEPTSVALLAFGGAVFGLRRKFRK